MRKLRQPTLVVSGDKDPVISVSLARMIARLIPNSRLHVVDGGHSS